MPYLGVLGSTLEKLLSYVMSTVSILSNCKVLCKNKNSLNLASKIPDLGIFRLEFDNTCLILEVGTLIFVLLQKFVQE